MQILKIQIPTSLIIKNKDLVLLTFQFERKLGDYKIIKDLMDI